MANAAKLSWCLTSHPKFWPKNPVTKVGGKKTVARLVRGMVLTGGRR